MLDAIPLLTAAQRADFDANGFVVVPGVLDEAGVARYRQAVLDAVERDWELYQHLPGKQQFIALDLVHHDPAFRQILEHEPVVSVFDDLLGPHWILYSMTSTVLPPGEHVYTCEIHNETVRVIDGYQTSALMTIALDDFTEANGSTWYLPGSHRDDKPAEDDFYARAVRVSRGAGDAVVFHPRVWHAGGDNTTDRVRVGFTIYGCRPWMKQRFDFPRFLGDSVLDELGPTGRRVLGFNARIPAAMDEFYRPPDQRLYLPGQD